MHTGIPSPIFHDFSSNSIFDWRFGISPSNGGLVLSACGVETALELAVQNNVSQLETEVCSPSALRRTASVVFQRFMLCNPLQS